MVEIENLAPSWRKMILRKKQPTCTNKPHPGVDEAGCEIFKALLGRLKLQID